MESEFNLTKSRDRLGQGEVGRSLSWETLEVTSEETMAWRKAAVRRETLMTD